MTYTMKRAIALASGLGAALAPLTALACPACAARGGLGAGIYGAIAALLAIPYGLAVVGWKVLRRLERDS